MDRAEGQRVFRRFDRHGGELRHLLRAFLQYRRRAQSLCDQTGDQRLGFCLVGRFRLNARRFKHPIRDFSRKGSLGEQNQLLPRELLRRDFRLCRQRALPCRDHDPLLPADRMGIEFRRRRLFAEDCVEFAGREPAEQLRRVAFMECKLHVRRRFQKARRHSRNEINAHRRAEAQTNRLFAARAAPDCLHALVQGAQRALRRFQKFLAIMREQHVSAALHKQRHAQLVLHQRDRMAQARLRDRQRLRRLRVVLQSRQRYEISQMIQIHASNLPSPPIIYHNIS